MRTLFAAGLIGFAAPALAQVAPPAEETTNQTQTEDPAQETLPPADDATPLPAPSPTPTPTPAPAPDGTTTAPDPADPATPGELDDPTVTENKSDDPSA